MKKNTFLILLVVALSVLISTSLVGAVDEPGQDPQPPDQVQGPIPADWPDEPGAMPELIGGEKADRPMVFYQGTTSVTPQSVDKATIEVWYGDEQNFGQLGVNFHQVLEITTLAFFSL